VACGPDSVAPPVAIAFGSGIPDYPPCCLLLDQHLPMPGPNVRAAPVCAGWVCVGLRALHGKYDADVDHAQFQASAASPMVRALSEVAAKERRAGAYWVGLGRRWPVPPLPRFVTALPVVRGTDPVGYAPLATGELRPAGWCGPLNDRGMDGQERFGRRWRIRIEGKRNATSLRWPKRPQRWLRVSAAR